MDDKALIQIDFLFSNTKPSFGDLFKMVGFDNPNFPSTDDTFLQLSDLHIEQVDDYFGIRDMEDSGIHDIVWIIPLVNNEEVFHHPGPFDGLRLQFNVLRNSTDKIVVLENVFNAFKNKIGTNVIFETQSIDNFQIIKNNIDSKISYWRQMGLEPGSEAALMYDEED